MTGQLFQRSDGLHGQGYALCLRCGRADSMLMQGEVPKGFKDHKRLRGGKLNDRERACPGNDEPWAISKGLILGVTTRTDLLELQLRDPGTGRPLDRTAAYTLGVALRRALCQKLGIEEGEVGTAALPTRDRDGTPAYSVYLFDTASGGAGYSSQAPMLLPDLLRDARAVLECPRCCDNACQACLLTVDSQHQLDNLNRHAALDLLSENFLDALALPQFLRAFGEHTHLEMEPLPLALSREWQRLPARELRVHLGGEADRWEPLAWSLRHDLVRFFEAGVTVRLLLPKRTLAELQDSQRGELAVLAGFSGAEVYETSIPATAGGLPLCVELAAEDQVVRWAASDPAALAPAPGWGSGGQGWSYVRAVGRGLLPLPAGARQLAPDALRPSPTGLVEIRIGEELDGPSVRFGEGAWGLVRDKAPALAQWLDGVHPLKTVQYTDRYLRSPLALHLLGSLLMALRHYPGGISHETTVTVQTARMERFTPQGPQVVHHDWRDAEDRRLVATTLLRGHSGVFIWIDDEEGRRLPHARELELEWSDGRRALLRLDQGVGYWRTMGGRTTFPFAADPARQGEALRQLRLRIAAMNHEYPTLWYIGTEGLRTPRLSPLARS